MLKWFLVACVATMTVPAFADEPSKADLPKGEAKLIPYRLTDTKHILVRVKINDKGPFNLILDTGAPAVFITEKSAKASGLATDKQGWAASKSFVLEGGLTVPGAKARVSDLFQIEGMNGMGLAGVELHGVIGYNVLSQYRITYDFTADKLAWTYLNFTPPAVNSMGKSNSQGSMDVLGPAMKMLAGFMGIKPNFETTGRGLIGFEVAEKDGKIVVEAVYKGSQADKVGLKVGDEIVGYAPPLKKRQSTPEPEDVERLKELVRLFDRLNPGDVFTLQIRRGEVKSLLSVTFGKGL